jgi:hypothetical protein
VTPTTDQKKKEMGEITFSRRWRKTGCIKKKKDRRPKTEKLELER